LKGKERDEKLDLLTDKRRKYKPKALKCKWA